jgi:hypothetical protein
MMNPSPAYFGNSSKSIQKRSHSTDVGTSDTYLPPQRKYGLPRLITVN